MYSDFIIKVKNLIFGNFQLRVVFLCGAKLVQRGYGDSRTTVVNTRYFHKNGFVNLLVAKLNTIIHSDNSKH